ncbi:uncharacterized protein E0L32_012296 [Thyridium curvatum]|uniref:Uncharacterized protein n=1 Tax=Thyridium curvatum TaxID=1093900 RepID=A0A507BI29_9PEZI|nr:uncharacterized protein E0L32_012296 [Thyridium curvatum]TPX17039.1 hypothetical protein E0L32_012296 [Thyridium curvatum]
MSETQCESKVRRKLVEISTAEARLERGSDLPTCTCPSARLRRAESMLPAAAASLAAAADPVDAAVDEAVARATARAAEPAEPAPGPAADPGACAAARAALRAAPPVAPGRGPATGPPALPPPSHQLPRRRRLPVVPPGRAAGPAPDPTAQAAAHITARAGPKGQEKKPVWRG